MTKMVYIAAPYESGGNINRNVAEAITWADTLRSKGYLPFCPHLFHFWDFYITGHDRSFWMGMCMDWVRRADVVFRLGGDSEGADIETTLAKSLGIPVVDTLKDLGALFNE